MKRREFLKSTVCAALVIPFGGTAVASTLAHVTRTINFDGAVSERIMHVNTPGGQVWFQDTEGTS